MRILGLDVGSRTVGVAMSDPMGWTAAAMEIIRINEDEGDFGLDRLGEIITANKVTGIVIGLPKNMNNSEGPRVDASRYYGKLVEDNFSLPIDFIDERLTTVEASRILIEEADMSREKRKGVIDKLAAQFILQNYLDSKGKLTL
jgi:putative Holliday junction resolvase